jgi:hypothetical protein
VIRTVISNVGRSEVGILNTSSEFLPRIAMDLINLHITWINEASNPGSTLHKVFYFPWLAEMSRGAERQRGRGEELR